MIGALQRTAKASYMSACERCRDWGGELVASLKPQNLLDVGSGDGALLFRYLKHKPANFSGVEAEPELKKQAEARGLTMHSFDLNGPWPMPNDAFDVVHSAQVIEHLHNTRMFVGEIFRVVKPGGTVLVSSENLTSFLNLGAMICGYTPFSLMRTCGRYYGNPLGLHYSEDVPEGVDPTHPAYAGITGHVRVLAALQAEEFFKHTGFVNVEVSSMGLMPLPDFLGRPLEKWMPRRGHFLCIKATKPL